MSRSPLSSPGRTPARHADLQHHLLDAATRPRSDVPTSPADAAEVTAIRALHPPAHHNPSAALLRIARAIDTETEGLYHRQDNGHTDADPTLRAIAFRLLELGFTIAEHGGLNCEHIETAIAQTYGLPGYDEAS